MVLHGLVLVPAAPRKAAHGLDGDAGQGARHSWTENRAEAANTTAAVTNVVVNAPPLWSINTPPTCGPNACATLNATVTKAKAAAVSAGDVLSAA